MKMKRMIPKKIIRVKPQMNELLLKHSFQSTESLEKKLTTNNPLRNIILNSLSKSSVISKYHGNYYARSRLKSQPFNKKFFNPVRHVVDNLEDFMRALTPVSHKILEYLFWMNKKHSIIYPTQERIARNVGASRQYVNKILGELHGLGIIQLHYRHLTSSTYRVSLFFKNTFIRSRLSHLFKVFYVESLSLLTQVIYNNKMNSNKRVKSYNFPSKISNVCQSIGNVLEFIMDNATFKRNSNPFSPYLSQIASRMRLTLAGLVRLSVFPDEALLYMFEKYKNAEHRLKGDYGLWLWKCAHEYCRINNIHPDWKFGWNLKEAYSIQAETCMIYASPVNLLPENYVNTLILEQTSTDNSSPLRENREIFSKHDQVKEQNIINPKTGAEKESAYVAKKKLDRACKDKSIHPFAKMLLEKYKPQFLVGDENEI